MSHIRTICIAQCACHAYTAPFQVFEVMKPTPSHEDSEGEDKEDEEEGGEEMEQEVVVHKEEKSNAFIGALPTMLMSAGCHLKGKSEAELVHAGECAGEVGGYFVIKGKEKVSA